jgi:hypothetical protein
MAGPARPGKLVAAMASEMQAMLNEHEEKKGEGWKEDGHAELYRRLCEEVGELGELLMGATDANIAGQDNEFSCDVVRECTDVANFAMFIADVVLRARSHARKGLDGL